MVEMKVPLNPEILAMIHILVGMFPDTDAGVETPDEVANS